jgi:acyl dehydratase
MASGQPSHLRAAARLLVAGVRRWGEGAASSPALTPARRLAVERQGITIDRARLRRYLAAVGAPRAGEAGDPEAALPPTYPAVWETALTLELLAADGLPFPSAGLLHLRSEIVSLRPLRVGDRIRCRVELEKAEAAGRGTQLLLRCRSWNGSGQLCQENATELLVRSRDAGATGSARAGGARESEGGAQEEWREVAVWEIPGDAGLRYARASGDFNPIHLWPWSSRLLGYPRPILHGHCSMAMIAGALASGGDFRRMEARFRAPLALPARVRLRVAGEGPVRFRLEDAARAGARPYVEGVWVGERGK